MNVTEQIAAIHEQMARKHEQWKKDQPRFIATDLPLLPEVRAELTGRTITIEADPADGARVLVERLDGRLVSVEPEREYDEETVIAAEDLAYHRNADFVRDALRLPPCPDWCLEKAHRTPDEQHFGPAAYLDYDGVKSAFMLGIEQEPCEEPTLIFRPSLDLNAGPVTLDQLKEHYASVGNLIDVVENLEAGR